MIVYNFHTNKVECLLNLDLTHFPFFTQRNNLYSSGGRYYFSTTFIDTIYAFESEELLKKYILDFGKSKFDTELFSRGNMSTSHVMTLLNENTDKIFHTPSLFINDKYLISNYSHNGRKYFIIRLEDEKFIPLSFEIQNDVDEGLPLFWIHALYDNAIVSIVDPNYLIERLTEMESEGSGSFHDDSNGFIKFASTLKPDDPHVMIMYYLK